MSETNNKNSFDFLEYAPGPFGNLYSLLTEKQKQEFKRFGAGAVTSTVTEAVELGRMLTDASVPDVLKILAIFILTTINVCVSPDFCRALQKSSHFV